MVVFSILTVLFLPAIQYSIRAFEIKSLFGSYTVSDQPDLIAISWNHWFDESFQHKLNKNLNDHLGFRPLLVRIYNQIDYTLFSKANANNIAIGKNKYALGYSYINAYLGIDYSGETYIRDKSWKMKFIQDTLAKLNKTFVVILAPGKASFYHEYIPGSFMKKKNDTTNYLVFTNAFDEIGLKYVDFNSYFENIKAKKRFNPIPQMWNSLEYLRNSYCCRQYIELSGFCLSI